MTAAHSAGIPVDVCGEAAGDPETLPLLVGLGVDELSVSPARLASTRRMIRSLTLSRARAATAEALSATTAEAVRASRAPRSTTRSQASEASRAAIASTAVAAASPLASTTTGVPPVAPSAST